MASMKGPVSRISIAQQKFSAIPYAAKEAFYSAELLASPCEKRAERGHENHPDLKEGLEYLTLLATNLRLRTSPPDSGAEVAIEAKGNANKEDNDCPHPTFAGEFVNSVENISDFIDVMDAALLHQLNADFYTKSKTQPGFVPKKIVIVGGGPSGMFAAVEARLHGHDVTVIEARSIGVRTRLLGLYPPEASDMARLGGPIELFHDSFSFCEKWGVTIYDLERVLGAMALKLGAKIYRNAVAQAPESVEDFEKGVLVAKYKPPSKVTKLPTTGGVSQLAIIKCNYHTQEHMPTKVTVNFDMIVDCAGSGRPITKFLLGKGNDNIDYLHVLAGEELRDESAKKAFYYDDDQHINDILDIVDWDSFLSDMEKGLSDPSVCPQNRHVTAFIANIGRDSFRKDKSVIDIMSKCAPEWIGIPIPSHRLIDNKPETNREKNNIWKKNLGDQPIVGSDVNHLQEDDNGCAAPLKSCKPLPTLPIRKNRNSMLVTEVSRRTILGITTEEESTTAELFDLPGGDADIDRILFEGMCPLKMTTGDGETVLSRDFLSKLNREDASIACYAYLTASIDPSNLDKEGFDEYIKKESSWDNQVQNATCVMVFKPKGVRCAEDFTFSGQVPGTKDDRPSYFVIGDACQDAWYRWGIGIHDAFNSTRCFSNCLGAMDANKDDPRIKDFVDQLQMRMRKRSVQTSAYFWHFGVILEKDPKMMKAYETMTKMWDMTQGKKCSK